MADGHGDHPRDDGAAPGPDTPPGQQAPQDSGAAPDVPPPTEVFGPAGPPPGDDTAFAQRPYTQPYYGGPQGHQDFPGGPAGGQGYPGGATQHLGYGPAPYAPADYGQPPYDAGQYGYGSPGYGDTGYGYADPGYTPQGYGQPGYGQPGYGGAAYADTAYGAAGQVPGDTPPTGGWYAAGAAQYETPYDQPAAAGPAGPRRRPPALIALVLLAVLALAGAAGGAVYWFALRDDPSPTAQSGTQRQSDSGGSSASGSDSESGDSSGSAAPCPTAPSLSSPKVASGPGGALQVAVQMSASCSDGDVIADDALTVNIAAGGNDVAAGTFDLSGTPLVLDGDDPRSMTLVFPEGTYWIPADAVGGDVTATAALSGDRHAASYTGGSGAGPTTLTADGPAAPSSGNADSAALDALRAIAEHDKKTITDAIANRWTAQLSSKQEGLQAEGRTWSNKDILDEFLAYKARYPDVLLAWSGDWRTFDLADWWVTLRGSAMPGPDAVLDFCRSEGYDRDHCLAKIVSNTRSPQDSTRMLPGG